MKQTISRNLKKLRGKLRQKEVAAAIGIKLSRYRHYELGTRDPGTEVLEKIRQYYGLNSYDSILKDVSA